MRKRPRSKKAFVYMERQGKNNMQMWMSWADKDEVVTQWGVVNGKVQETVDIPGPKGKKGTKAFIDPEQSALDQLVRDVKKRAQRGYQIVQGPSAGKFASALALELGGVKRADEISFDGPLPNNVAFSKPQNSVEKTKLLKLERRGDTSIGGPPLAWTVKKNGMCYVVSRDKDGKVWIQNRGKLIVENEKFPHLEEELEDFLPPKSILLCEFFVGHGRSREEFKGMQKIANSLPARALEMQKKIGLVRAYVFRVPFWKGANMEKNKPCTTWLHFLEAMIDGWPDESKPDDVQYGLASYEFLEGCAISDDSYEEAVEEMRQFGYEGWVVYDCYGSLGEKHVSFLGQPDRPNVCWKVKPSFEDDFIAMWEPDGLPAHCTSKCHIPNKEAEQKQNKSGKCCVCGKRLKPNGSYGTGKNMKRVGSVSLYQYDHQGIKQYICEVSSGLTDKQRMKYAAEGMILEVFEVEYKDRAYVRNGQDSNALQHPSVVQIRKDKDFPECVNKSL